MLLAVDIGNTNIVFGCVNDKDEVVLFERISTNHNATSAEYAVLIRTILEMNSFNVSDIDDAIMSSVVPSVTNTVKEAIHKLFGVDVMVAGPGVKTGLNILIDNPAQLGSDQAVDAVAAINEYPVPLIIIDMGTATTLSVVDSKKNYRGGLILTGMKVAADALTARTAQLPKVNFEVPPHVIGTNTIDCLKSGILYSNASALDGIIDRIEEELGEKCTAVATGGLSELVVPLCKRKIILDNNLLIKGLAIIYRKNKK
ncbi:type III pantothenate kinase [Ruminococcus flavefaciens]|uniref:Type III pantothenate kinase n=1 Tax=Ruminococcus flavefaciens TaxID=1265 RepID=A0A1H6J701_RUMFL|nr:type III pantothenate kinase [Ruminococcus flavefaciens]SEH57481.1 type III pantothenate kinase [Ruminococcus flavefaciens]